LDINIYDDNIISCDFLGNIKIFSLKHFKNIHEFKDNMKAVNKVIFSKDGTMIGSCSSDNSVKIYDFVKREIIASFNHNDKVNSICFSDDGSLLGSSSDDRTCKIYNIKNNQVSTLIGHTLEVYKCDFINNNLVSCSADDKLIIWENENIKYSLTNHKDDVINFDIYNNKIMSCSVNGEIYQWSSQSGGSFNDIKRYQIKYDINNSN
jgi:WD40 repeat protein